MIEITHYKPINKNSLMGTFSIKIPEWANFCIRELSYFKKGDRRWISFPSKQYEKDGQKKYFAYNTFVEERVNKAFQEKTLAALDAYLKKNNIEVSTNSDSYYQEEISF